MDAATLAPLVAAAINAGTPLMLAALGLLINEKSGVVNLGAEGMMLVAAIIGFAATVHSGSVTFGCSSNGRRGGRPRQRSSTRSRWCPGGASTTARSSAAGRTT